MSVGVLLITHGRIGHELLAAAGCILGSRPSDVLALGVPSAAIRMNSRPRPAPPRASSTPATGYWC
jgi:hypothetical protein